MCCLVFDIDKSRGYTLNTGARPSGVQGFIYRARHWCDTLTLVWSLFEKSRVLHDAELRWPDSNIVVAMMLDRARVIKAVV